MKILEMSVLSSNFKYLRKGKGFTQEELATELGITRSILGSYEEARAEPKLATLQIIATYFGKTIDELVTNDLSLASISSLAKEMELRILPIVVTPSNKELINVVPNKAVAGYLNGHSDTKYIKELSAFDLPLAEISSNRTYRIFQIKGDSMLPIPSDSYIISFFVENWKDIKQDECYVVLTKDDGIVYKRVSTKGMDKSELLLSSDNTDFEPYTIPVDTVIELWKAIGYISFQLPLAGDLSLEKLSSLVLELKKDMNNMKNNR